MTEREACAFLEERCRQYGSESPSFDTIVLFGRRSAFPHGRPAARKLRAGDFALFDFGCTVKGYCSDMTRTVVMGRASEAQKAIHATVQEAQRRAREMVKTGVPASRVDKEARACITDAGYGEWFKHATGHGIGRRVHECPRIHEKNAVALKRGMVCTIEPGIYRPDIGGVRIEDMVVVTDTGPDVLTRTSRRLMELTP
jgi:Xaa-Pro aminopeptidase